MALVHRNARDRVHLVRAGDTQAAIIREGQARILCMYSALVHIKTASGWGPRPEDRHALLRLPDVTALKDMTVGLSIIKSHHVSCSSFCSFPSKHMRFVAILYTN